MTHKNPELRGKQPVPSELAPKADTAKSKRGLPSGTPKFELVGSKWVVEYQDGNKNIVIDKPEVKHTVYIYGCYDTVVQITGKVNQITVDSCKKIGVAAGDVVSSVDLVNSSSGNVQLTGKCPTIAVDKVSGLQIYLDEKCKETEIITAKSDAINVLMAKGDGEFNEMPIPEQFKSVIKGNKLHTAQVDHSGG